MIRNAVASAALLFVALAAGCAPDVARPVDPPIDRDSAGGVRVAPEDDDGSARLILVPVDRSLPQAIASERSRPRLHVEVVFTNAARRRGLGGRTQLPADRGMLFVYPAARSRTFWMKDCAIGLDIAFLDDDGRILHVATLGPGTGLEGDEVPRATCPDPVRFVLEANAGYLAEIGVGTGDRVDVDAPTAGVVAE